LANEQFLSILCKINSKAAWLAVAGIIVVFQFYPRLTLWGIQGSIWKCRDFQFYPRSTLFTWISIESFCKILSILSKINKRWRFSPFFLGKKLSILSKINSFQDTVQDDIRPWAFNSIQDQLMEKEGENRLFFTDFQFYPRSTWSSEGGRSNNVVGFQFYPRSTIPCESPPRGLGGYLSILSKINWPKTIWRKWTQHSPLSILSKIN